MLVFNGFVLQSKCYLKLQIYCEQFGPLIVHLQNISVIFRKLDSVLKRKKSPNEEISGENCLKQ